LLCIVESSGQIAVKVFQCIEEKCHLMIRMPWICSKVPSESGMDR
jgi:hypothetical protein